MSQSEAEKFIDGMAGAITDALAGEKTIEAAAIKAKAAMVAYLEYQEASGEIDVYPQTVGMLRQAGAQIADDIPDDWPARLVSGSVRKGDEPGALAFDMTVELSPTGAMLVARKKIAPTS